jgi:type I restriction enzyme S subunit
MSKLKELIDKLCPDGVEYKEVQTICRTNTPKGKVKSNDYLKEGKYPVIDQGQNFIGGYTNEEYSFPDGEYVIFGDHTCIVKYVNFAFVQGADGVKVLTSSDDILTKYLYYCMSNIFMPVDYARHWSKMKVAAIPLPPIEVQEEIVRILDNFTKCTAELQAELQAREEQYEYYRNKLLSFNKIGGGTQNVEWKKMSEICINICSGGTPSTSKREYYQGYIPWLRTQEVDWKDVYDTSIKISEEAIMNSSAKLIPANCVIIAMYGATAGKTCINKIPLTTNQACCNLQVNEEIVMYKYVYHWLCREYKNLKALGEGCQSNISGKKIKSYKIPVPSLTEQERIVNILDKFETLVKDLSQGLPAEIEARQNQYEYYRNKLLSFKRLTT